MNLLKYTNNMLNKDFGPDLQILSTIYSVSSKHIRLKIGRVTITRFVASLLDPLSLAIFYRLTELQFNENANLIGEIPVVSLITNSTILLFLTLIFITFARIYLYYDRQHAVAGLSSHILKT